MRISVVVPVHNEEKVLGGVIDKLKDVLKASGHEPEIIVVDDASTDGTYDAARSRGGVVLRHEKNLGYGAALKTGVGAASSEYVLIVDGDGSYPIDEIPGLLGEAGDCDMVVGARTKKGVAMSIPRRIAKFFLGKLAEYLVKERIPDINSGLRVFRKSLYEETKRLLPDGFSFTLTITLAAMSGRKKIKFIPINYNKRTGRSKIRPVHDTLSFFMLVLSTVLFFNPLRVFLPAAALFFIAALALTFYSVLVLGRFMDVSVILLFVFGAQFFFLGLIADLINRRSR